MNSVPPNDLSWRGKYVAAFYSPSDSVTKRYELQPEIKTTSEIVLQRFVTQHHLENPLIFPLVDFAPFWVGSELAYIRC